MGQVLLSQATLTNWLEIFCRPSPVPRTWDSIGSFKDLQAPEHVWAATGGIPSASPRLSSPNSLDYLPTNLPQQVTSFIGREKEIAEVKELLKKTGLAPHRQREGTVHSD